MTRLVTLRKDVVARLLVFRVQRRRKMDPGDMHCNERASQRKRKRNALKEQVGVYSERNSIRKEMFPKSLTFRARGNRSLVPETYWMTPSSKPHVSQRPDPDLSTPSNAHPPPPSQTQSRVPLFSLSAPPGQDTKRTSQIHCASVVRGRRMARSVCAGSCVLRMPG